MTRLTLLLVCLMTSFLNINCASQATVSGMTVSETSMRFKPQMKQSVTLGVVNGGQDTHPLWSSQVSNENFRSAVTNSLKNAGLLAENPALAPYTLVVSLKDVKQPLFGLDMTVQTSASYMLVDKKTNKSIFSEDISRAGTAQFTDSFFGMKRLRLANELAVRANIEAFLQSLTDFDPKKPLNHTN